MVVSGDPRQFNATHASEMLGRLAGLGIRTVGSNANDVLAVEMLMAELQKVQDDAQKRDGGGSAVIEVEKQSASGTFQ